MKEIYLQALGIWIVMVFLAIINGTLRNNVYGPKMTELLAHQLSTVIYIAIFILMLFLFFSRTSTPYSQKDLVMIGILWLFLTIMFEFGFGHYIMGHPWSRLLNDYDLFQGRLWMLVLITELTGPYLIGRIFQ
ncbi:MAG: hypothetical protein HXS53_12825 [Theionarchaea archaeon]|nr:hypothetical protein [Theionarchaea archaeon]